MKCKICGHRANSLPAMRKHYQKAHPGAMKRKRKKKAETASPVERSSSQGGITIRYCPRCGEKLGG